MKKLGTLLQDLLRDIGYVLWVLLMFSAIILPGSLEWWLPHV